MSRSFSQSLSPALSPSQTQMPFTPDSLLLRRRPIYGLKQQAKRLSKEQRLPLHKALDLVAQEEGFASWSLLLARRSALSSSEQPVPALLLSRLQPGDFLLLGARPGQGKTLLALGLLIECLRKGGAGACFSMDYSERELLRRFKDLGFDPGSTSGQSASLLLDSSDNICADHIQARLSDAAPGTLVVVDYLQLLDQRRDTPPLSQQLSSLKDLAGERGLRFVFLSQIDRRFEMQDKRFPELEDVRRPNPLDLSIFTKTCFLNGDSLRFSSP
ncbi:DNA helicase [Rhodovibrionaceae bacterium A322]